MNCTRKTTPVLSHSVTTPHIPQRPLPHIDWAGNVVSGGDSCRLVPGFGLLRDVSPMIGAARLISEVLIGTRHGRRRRTWVGQQHTGIPGYMNVSWRLTFFSFSFFPSNVFSIPTWPILYLAMPCEN